MKRLSQINASKLMILNALLAIMKDKDIKDISLSEIIEQAQVSRMTLYRHFKSKEDILLYAFEISSKQVLEDLKKIDEPSLLDLLSIRFILLRENHYTEALAKSNYLDKIFEAIGSQYVDQFSQYLPNFKDEYAFKFLIGGLDAMTYQWIRNGMKESAYEMANKVYGYIKSIER